MGGRFMFDLGGRRWPFLRTVEQSQNDDRVIGDGVDGDPRQAREWQFAGAIDTPRASPKGMISQRYDAG